MPSIRQELEETRTARWFRDACRVSRAAAWADRMRDYAALRAVLTEHAAEARPPAGRRSQRPVELAGMLRLVAEREHYAGAEPVYRRYRGRQHGQQIVRWAGPDATIRPAAALLAEAKIAGFWPYREGVIMVADEFGMTPPEWAAAYLRALAAWAGEDRLLAACHPVSVPPCVPEDMAVLAASHARQACEPPAEGCATRLHELAGELMLTVLDDASVTPLGAFNTVCEEVGRLLAPPPVPLADQALCAVAELSDRIIHADAADTVITPDQAGQLRGLMDGLAMLLSGITAPEPIPVPEPVAVPELVAAVHGGRGTGR